MNKKLKDSISHLYETFRRYPLDPDMDASPVYGNREEYNSLLSGKPLESLTSDDLCIFAGKTMTTRGNVSDFKHFLPRMLELAAFLDSPYEVFILFSKLEYARWEIWDEHETGAVRSYLEALWEFLLSSYSEAVNTEFFDYFISIFRVYPSTDTLLSSWERSEQIEPLLHLCDIVTEHQSLLNDRKESSPGFSLGPRALEIREWLSSPGVSEKIEKAFFDCEREDYQQKLSDALGILSGIQ